MENYQGWFIARSEPQFLPINFSLLPTWGFAFHHISGPNWQPWPCLDIYIHLNMVLLRDVPTGIDVFWGGTVGILRQVWLSPLLPPTSAFLHMIIVLIIMCPAPYTILLQKEKLPHSPPTLQFLTTTVRQSDSDKPQVGCGVCCLAWQLGVSFCMKKEKLCLYQALH